MSTREPTFIYLEDQPKGGPGYHLLFNNTKAGAREHCKRYGAGNLYPLGEKVDFTKPPNLDDDDLEEALRKAGAGADAKELAERIKAGKVGLD